MLYIATALYPEAKPFITAFSLKQLHEHNKFQIFANDVICLIITGSGTLRASIAISYLFQHWTVQPNDLLLNFGLCGTTETSIPLGTTYVFHHLHDYSTGNDLYPDMLLHLPYPEAALETCPLAVGPKLSPSLITEKFVDMEAYAIMFAATYYMQPHQLLFLKVVSDYATEASKHLPIEQLNEWLTKATNDLITQLELYSSNYSFFPETLEPIELSSVEMNALDTLASYLRLSETMRHDLIQHILYHKCRNGKTEQMLLQAINNPTIQACKSNIEGKIYFEQLKQRFME